MNTLNRRDLLKLAALAGGAGVVAGPTAVADAARTMLAAESGSLQVLDWAGYGNDGGQAMFAAYVKAYPKNKPQFTYMTNESDALAKLHAGLKPDIFRPYVGWTRPLVAKYLTHPTYGRNRSALRPAWSLASASDSFVMYVNCGLLFGYFLTYAANIACPPSLP